MIADLTKLSYAEKQRAYELLKLEDSLKKKRPIDGYVPHAKQLEFHKSNAQIRLFAGSNRSGKSHAGVCEDVWTALGIHPYREIKVPNKGWICATDYPHGIATVILPKLMSMLPTDCIARTINNSQGIPSIIQFKNGSVIEFKSYDQDQMKFESSDFDWIHLDEPCKERVYNAVMRGLTDRNGRLWMTMTPLSEAWLFTKLWMPGITHTNPLIECFKMSIYDNPYLSKEGVEQFAATVSDDYKQARLYGEFQQLQGRVFKNFNYKTHVLHGFVPPPQYVCYMGVDPHVYGRKNQAALWCCITPDDDIVFFDEIWKDYTIETLRDKIIEHDFVIEDNRPTPRYNIAARVIDTSINIREAMNHTNFKNVIEATGKYGKRLSFKMAQKKNLLNSGLEYINVLLDNTLASPHRTPRIFVDDKCTRLIEELDLHGWKNSQTEDKVEKELNTYNDMISIVRYILSMNPVAVKHHVPLRLQSPALAASAHTSHTSNTNVIQPSRFGSYAGPSTIRYGGFYGR